MSDVRNWCEVPIISTGGPCTRHTNWQASVGAQDYKRAFPHDKDVKGHFGPVSLYICGNHRRTLIDKGTATTEQFTHLDGPGGLLRF